jgi:DNA invertase Pin-like site-specific DNA recombinase
MAASVTWAIYARQSLDRDGAGLAIDRQVADCRALAARVGLPPPGVVYADNDISASGGRRRPAYEQLIDDLRDGAYQTLIIWHNDRLHRRPAELEAFIAVAEDVGLHILTVQAGDLDLSTPSGRMVARILGAAARQEVEHKGARRARAIRQRAEDGHHYGATRGFGYGRTVIGPNGRSHDVDLDQLNPREANAIRAASRAILCGTPTTTIWRHWNTSGLLTPKGNPWTGSAFRNSLLRPAIAGLVVYRGEILPEVPARWPPIVTAPTWQALGRFFADPSRYTARPKPLRGPLDRVAV